MERPMGRRNFAHFKLQKVKHNKK